MAVEILFLKEKYMRKNIVLAFLALLCIFGAASCKWLNDPANGVLFYNDNGAKDLSASNIDELVRRMDRTGDNGALSILIKYNCAGTAVAFILTPAEYQLCSGKGLLTNWKKSASDSYGNVIISKGFGYADYPDKKVDSEKTVFNVASISKPVSAWGALYLSVTLGKKLENGVLEDIFDLNRPAQTYLDDWTIESPNNYDVSLATVSRLITHQSGIKQGGVNGYMGWSSKLLDAPDPYMYLKSNLLLESLTLSNHNPLKTTDILNGLENNLLSSKVKLYNEPGYLNYSGGEYMVLQLIMENLLKKYIYNGSYLPVKPDHQLFCTFMQDIVMADIGMQNSTFHYTDSWMNDPDHVLAKCYGIVDWSKPSAAAYETKLFLEKAPTGLYCTVEDYAKFILLGMTSDINPIYDENMNYVFKPDYTEINMKETDDKKGRNVEIDEQFDCFGSVYGWNSGYKARCTPKIEIIDGIEKITGISGKRAVIVLTNSGDSLNYRGQDVYNEIIAAWENVKELP
jgi:hypothetical protein